MKYTYISVKRWKWKKKKEKKSITVNQPIWRNSLQRISRDLPPEEQFRLPIFPLEVEGELFSDPSSRTTVKVAHFHSQGWRWALLTWRHMWTSRLTKRHLVRNVHYHVRVETFITGLSGNWTLHRMHPPATVQRLCFCGQTGLFQVNILFQKLNPRFTDTSLIKKIMYMRGKRMPPTQSCLWTSQGEEEQGEHVDNEMNSIPVHMSFPIISKVSK